MSSTSQGPRQQLEQIIAVTPFARLMGATVQAFGDGIAELEIEVKPELMHQHHGFVHGAIVGFMADSACAWAAASLAGDVVTAEYKLNLLAPARGERLRAQGRVLKAGGRTLVVQADVFAIEQGREKHVAVALASIAKVGAA
ncbi:PaaI family thioesterase [Pseudomonas citronellolis]|uniref:PaaI family thioesterase n=1 Tax=Pseudomonas citronellolis TaxID=53408 RepID=UPI0023E3543C|nr:PaaI family thioesterase [Pseudomonas citronellolis]MDF3933698.1 PaaI family thioesterase [Pseudomonas citronellolis]